MAKRNLAAGRATPRKATESEQPPGRVSVTVTLAVPVANALRRAATEKSIQTGRRVTHSDVVQQALESTIAEFIE